MGKTHIKRFETAKERGTVIEKDGYHQCRNCNCILTTRKGAYRDISIELDGNTYHFYHQNLVVQELEDKFILDSCGYQTKTTKERINRYIPSGFKVVQRDFDWYLIDPNGDKQPFEDNMAIMKSYDKTDKIMKDIDL